MRQRRHANVLGLALAVARFDEETYASAAAEYLASLAPYRKGKGYDVPGEFVVAVGHKPEASEP